MDKEALYTARWHILNNVAIPPGPIRDAMLDVLRPILGDEPKMIENEPLPETDKPIIPTLPDQAKITINPWMIPDGKPFPIVGQFFKPDEFIQYLKLIAGATKWNPIGVTMHGTSDPSLSMRPVGFIPQHMLNLRSYYMGMKWTAGPHLFVDDLGIWVFSPLDRRGTHSPSFNNTRFGIEMLGDYDYDDDPWSGRGLRVMHNGMIAAAGILKIFGLGSGKLNFHRHDSETSHRTCPGAKIDFAKFEEGMISAYNSL